PKENLAVRVAAVEAVAKVGPVPAVRDAAAALLAVLEEKGNPARVRQVVLWALRGLNLRDLGALDAYARVLGETHPDHRRARCAAARELAYFLRGDVPEPVLDVLLEYLKDPSVKVYLGQSGSAAKVGAEVKSGPTQVAAIVQGDGRLFACGALSVIGRRVRDRAGVVAQPRRLADDPGVAGPVRAAGRPPPRAHGPATGG